MIGVIAAIFINTFDCGVQYHVISMRRASASIGTVPIRDVVFAPHNADCVGTFATECQYVVRLLLLPC